MATEKLLRIKYYSEYRSSGKGFRVQNVQLDHSHLVNSWIYVFMVILNQIINSMQCFKVNNKNTRKRCEMCSKLTIKTPERHYWHSYGIFIIFEYILLLFLVFLLLTLNRQVLARYLLWNKQEHGIMH